MRNVIFLILGTGISQAIPLVLSPVLTRLYAPENFGIFGVTLSAAAIMAIIITCRYELAINITKYKKTAVNLVILVFGLSLLFCFLIIFLLFIFDWNAMEITGLDVRYVLAYTFSLVLFQVSTLWLNRLENFKQIASFRLMSAVIIGAAQVLFGFIDLGNGLILGAIFGNFLTGLIIFSIFLKGYHNLISARTIKYSINRYLKFPILSLPANLLNSFSYNSPTIFINFVFGATSAGYYSVTQRMVGAPVNVVGGAFGDVFRQKASQRYNEIGNCIELFDYYFKKLVLISIIPSIVFFIYAVDLFELVFGEGWGQAGEYAKYLLPMFVSRFIAFPLSNMFYIAERQRIDLIIHVLLFCSMLLVFFVGFFAQDIELILKLFSLSFSSTYLVCIYFSRKFAKGSFN